MSYDKVLQLPLVEVKKLLRLIRVKDLSKRVYETHLAVLGRTPFGEEDARGLKEILGTVLPESDQPEPLPAPRQASERPTQGSTSQVDLQEQATLDLLARAGSFPVRGPNAPKPPSPETV